MQLVQANRAMKEGDIAGLEVIGNGLQRLRKAPTTRNSCGVAWAGWPG
jgi:hypothetical protein